MGATTTTRFSRDVLAIDCAATAGSIEQALPRQVGRELRRRGVVVGISGGVDSAVCATLAARALGRRRVLGLLLPERDSPPLGTARARRLCEALGIDYHVEDISGVLEALGCYRERDAAVRELFPQFGPGYRCKIAVAADLLDRDRVNYFNLVVESPAGQRFRRRMPLEVYLAVVAATNMKQRARKLREYYHAERRNYAVLGTPNRLEYELGFFVRGGDGLADVKPLAHLYKSQVYALAEHLGVPSEIRGQTPSTDTYSLPQTQEEFYFALPYDLMDLLLWAFSNGVPPAQAAAAVAISPDQVQRVYRDIAAKRRLAERLRQPAILLGRMCRPGQL